jgi:nucleoside-diphosphate-sugar epimerase
VITLITGGNGHLGRFLVQALQERGDTARVLALPGEDTRWLEARGVEVHRGDIRDSETLAQPMRGVEAVFHLAAMIGVWRPMADYYAVNVIGTENVCRAALAEAVRRLVHVSSWTVYGMGLGEPVSEAQPPRPLKEPHVLTKLEGEKRIRQMIVQEQLPAVILRPGTFFGPNDQLHFGRIADRLRAGRWVVIGPGENALPLVYVADVVQGLLLALDSEAAVGETYNITHDDPLTQQQFLDAIANAIGAEPPRRRVPYRALYAASCVAERVAKLPGVKRPPVVSRLGVKLFGTDNRHAIDKARRELGYAPQVALREGVRLAADWYRAQDTSGSSPARDVALVDGTRAA